MKNFFKKLTVALILLASVATIQASTLSLYVASQTTNGQNLFSNGVVVYRITLQNTNNVLTAGNQVGLFDAGLTATNGATNINFVAPAYTNAAFVVTNHVILFTNIVGATETQTNSVLVQSNTVVAAALTSKPLVYLTTVASGTNTTVYQPTYPLQFFQGLVVTNGAGITVTIDYAPIK